MANSQAVSVFQFQPSFDVRVIVIDGNPWFVASDVAAALEYRDAANMTRFLDDDDKGTHIVSTPSGDQQMTIINESGLYSAILKSRKPEAKKFKKWVTSEVLPSIRKTGSYTVPSVEYISQQQYDELTKTVTHIAQSFKYDKAWWWIWADLRQKTGMVARYLPVNRFEEAKRHLKAFQGDCEVFHQLMFNAESVLFARYKAFFDLKAQAELAFLKQNVNLVPVEIQTLLDELV